MFVKNVDLPDWTKNILKGHGIRKDISVQVGVDVNIGPKWHDADVVDIYLYKDGNISRMSGWGEPNPSITRNKGEYLSHMGFKTTLSPNNGILVVHTYPKSAILYVHPDNIAKFISGSSNDDLTNEEKFVIELIGSLISSARRPEANRYGIKNYDEIVNILIGKGYLNNKGALTTQGKNYRINSPLKHKSTWEMAKEFGFKGSF